ncbi:MAG: TetR family transcriptional regulator [Acidimicrobiia bacterium]|nr:TetR family transcriptional regulator [Acidimicrobiia bacterium]
MPKAIAQADGRPNTARSDGVGTTRDRLVTAMGVALARSGWNGVTTRQVATLAGVNQALVHYHFSSMDALRREATVELLAQEVSGPTLALLGAPTVREGLRACLAALGELDPRSDTSLVLFEAMLASARDPELRTMLHRALVSFRDLVAERIRHDGGSDPAGSAIAITAALDGVLLHRLVDREVDPSHLADALVAALQLPDGDRAPARSKP